MDALLQYFWNGVASGAVYALIAIGITLVYGLSRIVNFAIGEFLMFGGLVSWTVLYFTGSFVLAAVAALACAAIIGVLSERGFFQFTLGEPTAGFIVSLGLILVFRGIGFVVWGSDTRNWPPPLKGAYEWNQVIVLHQGLLNTLICAVAITAFYLLLHKTKFGLSLRAMADDPRSAELVGVPVRAVILSTFAISAALAGLAGWMVLTVAGVSPISGAPFILKGFAVALVGGLGNIQGAALAGLGLGIAENLAIGYGSPGWSDIYVFGLVIAVLLWRPHGLQRGVEGSSL